MARWTWPNDAAAIGSLFEIGEGFRDSHAQLGADDFLDLVETKRLHFVLQAGERLEVRLRQQFDPGREELPELDEGRPQFLQIVGQLVCLRRFRRRDPLLGGEGLGKSGLLHQIGPAVLHEDPGDLAIAIEVLRFE